MLPEDKYKWHVQLVQARHQGLELNFEQAELLYKYEREKENRSKKYSLTFWEEWDLDFISVKEILTPKQFEIYEPYLKTQIDLHIEQQKTADAKRLNDIGYYTEMFGFYEQYLFPGFVNAPVWELYKGTVGEGDKIEHLKGNYRLFLNDSKKKLIIDHLRHNRTFSPNELKIGLLKHSIGYLWPNYFAFKQEMDPEVKNIATCLEIKISSLPDEVYNFVNDQLEALRNFNRENSRKHFKIPDGSYWAYNYMPDKEFKMGSLMSFLLLDKQKYS